MFTRKSFLGLAAVAALGLTAQSAFASASADTVSVKINYAGMDLSSHAGAQIMAARIRQASREICGGDERDSADLGQRKMLKACVDHTSAEASTKLGAPMVTSMLGETGATIAVASR